MSVPIGRTIKIDAIDPNPDQPRRDFAHLLIETLAESIKVDGLLEPILVRPIGDRFQIVHGERRWRASKLAGLEEIDAVVRDMDDDRAFELALVENIQRQDLNAMEEGHAFQKLASKGKTQVAIGELIGKSQQYVADRLSLLRLPKEVQHLVTARAVNPSLARRLLSVPEKSRQIRLAEEAAYGMITVRSLQKQLDAGEEKFRKARLIARATVDDQDRIDAYVSALVKSGKARSHKTFAEMVKDFPALEQYTDAM